METAPESKTFTGTSFRPRRSPCLWNTQKWPCFVPST
jgi:hypothetical protein